MGQWEWVWAQGPCPVVEEHAFRADCGAVRSSSSEGLARAPGLSSEGSLESNEVPAWVWAGSLSPGNWQVGVPCQCCPPWPRGQVGKAAALRGDGKPTLMAQDSDPVCKSPARRQTRSYMKAKNRHSSSDSQWPPSTGPSGTGRSPGTGPQAEKPASSGPQVR